MTTQSIAPIKFGDSMIPKVRHYRLTMGRMNRLSCGTDLKQRPQKNGLSADVFPLKKHTVFVEGQSREPIVPLKTLLEAIRSGHRATGRPKPTTHRRLKFSHFESQRDQNELN